MNSRRNLPLTRRQVLGQLGLMAAAMGVPLPAAAGAETQAVPWRVLPGGDVEAQGYGTDPDLVQPVAEPWPRMLSDRQLQLLEMLADIILPAEGPHPAASAADVPRVVDHWLSAPYPAQSEHRVVVLSGLDWLQRESRRRFGLSFERAAPSQQRAILDEIAFEPPSEGHPLRAAAEFFALLRGLVTGAYYSSPAGLHELGYVGNVPIAGDYPGPTPAAMAHLETQLERLGLSRQADTVDTK